MPTGLPFGGPPVPAEHERVTAARQLLAQRRERHTRLQHDVAQALVELDDPVHPPAQVHDDLALADRAGAALAGVLAGADRPQLDPVLAGGTDDQLHLLGAGRIDDARR